MTWPDATHRPGPLGMDTTHRPGPLGMDTTPRFGPPIGGGVLDSYRPMPPLLNLPPPPRVEPEDPGLVPPAEILAESVRALTRRLLRLSPVPAVILVALWALLFLMYVLGASPTMWFLAALASLADPSFFRYTLTALGFSANGLWITALLLPVGATGVSLALLPLAARWIAGLNPRDFLSERAFQQAVSSRVTWVLIAPVILTITLLLLAIAVGAPLQWQSFSPGPLSMLCAAVLAVQAAFAGIRAWMRADRILQIPSADALERTARIDPDLEKRHRAAAAVLAQDRRHLPPNPGTPQARAAARPAGAWRALRLISARALVWVLPALASIGWAIFAMVDVTQVFSGMLEDDLLQVRGQPLDSWMLLLGIPALLVLAVAVAFAPALAVQLAGTSREGVIDQRPYAQWEHRARVNRWEASAVAWTGGLVAGACIAVVLGHALLTTLVGHSTALLWTGVFVAVLIVAPLLAGAAVHAMRSDLRTVLYGPPGWYMRRETTAALVAPDIGTRTQRGQDPAVRAALRTRLRAQAGDHELELFDLDAAAGEKLWLDESLPGAKDTDVREADVSRGILPDFGADDSPFQASPDQDRTSIPDTVRGLQER